METQPKITVMGVLSEGTSIGLKNALSLLGALILWILTCWIPYINVGTTIALYTIPIELSKGKVISPLFIFDGKYRQYMGEFFTLIGLMLMSLIPAFLFMVVPGIIISLGWCLALFLLIDKGLAPGEALVQSNKATYGYKWTIFAVFFLIGLALFILQCIFFRMGGFGLFLYFIVVLLACLVEYGCLAVIYRNLTRDAEAAAPSADEPVAPVILPAAPETAAPTVTVDETTKPE